MKLTELNLIEELIRDGISLRDNHSNTCDAQRFRDRLNEGYEALALFQKMKEEIRK